MSDDKRLRLRAVMQEFNLGLGSIVDFLAKKGHSVESKPTTQLSEEQYSMVQREFSNSAAIKQQAKGVTVGGRNAGEDFVIDATGQHARASRDAGRMAPSSLREQALGTQEGTRREASKVAEPVAERVERPAVTGPKVLGKIDLDAKPKPPAPKPAEPAAPVAEKPAAPVSNAVEAPVAPPAAPQPAPVVAAAEAKQTEAKPSEPAAPAPQQEAAKPAAAEVPAAKAEAPAKPAPAPEPEKVERTELAGLKVLGKIDLNAKPKPAPKPAAPAPKPEPQQPAAQEAKPVTDAAAPAEPTTPVAPDAAEGSGNVTVIKAEAEQLKGLTVLGKIELPVRDRNGKPGGGPPKPGEKRQRKRVKTTGTGAPSQAGAVRIDDPGRGNRPGGPGGRPGGPGQGRPGQGGQGGQGRPGQGGNRNAPNTEITGKQIQDQIKATMARMGGTRGATNNRAKYRRDKRAAFAEGMEERMLAEQQEAQILRVTEFISVSDLASLMDVDVNEVISTCLSIGLFVSINQRLDAKYIGDIAEFFGYKVEFATADEEEVIVEEPDAEEDLSHRAPIVTIMGHVDHGKTSLLDYIRKTKVVAGEAGGITQHIGAYDVTTESGRSITFLDTPGHEAFTAMRARGAKVTDVVIIVVAADDNVMPQTKEAINHAQAAGVPMVIAINKIDKAGANPDKIREELAQLNILVEEWGGKFQCQEISAKQGIGINELLEKVLLEAELLELKANADRRASGTVIEASLDKGRGYVTTLLVQNGTLNIGDIILVGQYFGRVKAMTDHTGKRLKQAGPSIPVQVLGLDGAPQAGDKFNVMEKESDARDIATKRQQIIREQTIRTRKHLTLEDIARRRAKGSFHELNLIVKGDVDGSVEALSDSLQKLSTDEVSVRILHKAVGQISESDVLLATAADAVIVGFQVRPSPSARKLAEQEQIEIRSYSIIYDAINEIKDAMVGMLAPKFEEVVVGTAVVRETFKIGKSLVVAGCYVQEGYLKRNNKVRLVRDGIVVFNGDVDALKRFKDDVSEVKFGYECGLSIKNYNDIRMDDVLESIEQREIKRSTL